MLNKMLGKKTTVRRQDNKIIHSSQQEAKRVASQLKRELEVLGTYGRLYLEKRKTGPSYYKIWATSNPMPDSAKSVAKIYGAEIIDTSYYIYF